MSKNSSYQELLKMKPEPKVFVLEDFVESFFVTTTFMLVFVAFGIFDWNWKWIVIASLASLLGISLIIWFHRYTNRKTVADDRWLKEYVLPYLSNLPENTLIEQSDIVRIEDLDADGCWVTFIFDGKLRRQIAGVRVSEVESPYITCVEHEENVYHRKKGDLSGLILHVSKEDLKKCWTA